jgi:hypothetical protein
MRARRVAGGFVGVLLFQFVFQGFQGCVGGYDDWGEA